MKINHNIRDSKDAMDWVAENDIAKVDFAFVDPLGRLRK